MPSLTTTYEFSNPTPGADDDVWGGLLNANFTKLDLLFTGAFDAGDETTLGTLKAARLPSTIPQSIQFSDKIRMEAAVPRIEFRDTNEALPSGLFRLVMADGTFTIQRNTAVAGDFSTTVNMLRFLQDASVVVDGLLRVTSLNVTGTLEGVSFGTVLASSTSNLSAHIDLYDGDYGFNVTSARMNIVHAAGASTRFVYNGVEGARIDVAGFSGDLDAADLAAGFVPAARLAGQAYTFGVVEGTAFRDTNEGSAGTPSFSSVLDSDTGVFFGTSRVRFSCDGVERGSVGAAGFYGSGANLTTIPAEELTGTLSMARIATGDITNAKLADDTLGAEKFQAGATETTWIATNYSNSADNAIGTLGLLKQTAGADVAPNAVVTAASRGLQRSSAGGIGSGSTVPGTWKCLGFSDASAPDGADRVALYIRTA